MKSRYNKTCLMVTPAQRNFLDFCEKALPHDVFEKYLALKNIDDIILRIKNFKNLGRKPHDILICSYNNHKYDSLKAVDWYDENDNRNKLKKFLIAEETEFERLAHNKEAYIQATRNYRNHLENAIKEFTINNNQKKLTKQKLVIIKKAEKILLGEKRLAYLYDGSKSLCFINQDQMLPTKANIKNRNQSHVLSEVEGFFTFLSIKENQSILTTRRDNALITFLKALGVGVGLLFLIIPGYFAYQSFFGERATEGNKYINKISETTMQRKQR